MIKKPRWMEESCAARGSKRPFSYGSLAALGGAKLTPSTAGREIPSPRLYGCGNSELDLI